MTKLQHYPFADFEESCSEITGYSKSDEISEVRMMHYVWIMVMLISSTALSQELENLYQKDAKALYDMRELQRHAELFAQQGNQDINTFRFGDAYGRPIKLSEFIIESPVDLPKEEKAKVLELFSKIKDICPDCSTGTTVNGKPLIGLNVPDSKKPPLFSVENLQEKEDELTCITKTEYEQLKLTAALYETQKVK